MSAIELRSVSKSYNGRKAVDGFSLSIAHGERVVLVGPSGSGKTTVLRLVAGLETPDSGAISIGGTLVAESGRNLVEPERRHVGMVFQDLALWPNMTVYEHLAFVLRYDRRRQRADGSARVGETLRMVRMADRAQARPGELSGGEQQRVALARALVANPTTLLMDEPLSSLDPELSTHLRREILSLHAELGFTLLYVTHSREEAAELGSRVIAMRHGKLAAQTREPNGRPVEGL
ncbi:MAG TPA: ABC transporter ATP-binding protein [Burkholderiales bacterium]|nr:ABC transporter ATP-binding protein [Burkholderiales bacterium]